MTPISKAKAARASDPGREDSGVLRLADLQTKETENAEAAAAAAEASLAAAVAKRAEGQQAAAAPVIAKPVANENKGSSTGMWAGVAIAVMGIAAAFAFYKTRTPEMPPAPVAATTEAKPSAAPVAEAPKPQPTAEPAAAVASADPTPAATGAPVADDPKGGTAGGAPAPTAVAVASNDTKSASPAASLKGSKVGTLDEEMKKAVGGSDLPSAPQDDGSKPAAASGNVPEQPSQGNAQAAVRAVLPGAKACVAGAPESTSASITFGSSGGVQSVSVGGWAAANGKAGCVKSALQGARVAPFAKPTFTVPVTVRP